MLQMELDISRIQVSIEWMNEIKKRCREIDEGKVKPIPGEEGLNQLREKYK